MRHIHFVFVVLLFTLALTSSQAAYAFTTEKGSDMMGGDSSNFTDPDEQQPALLQGSDGQSSNYPVQYDQSPLVIDQDAAREQALGLSQAFDHAYSEK